MVAPLPVTYFTPRKRMLLLAALKEGQTIQGACAKAGISRATYYDHVNSEPEFAEQIEKARGIAESRLIDAVTKSAHTGETVTTPGGQVTVRPGDWRAAAWLLEHHPHTRERYAAPAKVQIAGDPDNPTPVSIEATGDAMTSTERLAAVITILQRAGVAPIPEPGQVIVLESPPDDQEST